MIYSSCPRQLAPFTLGLIERLKVQGDTNAPAEVLKPAPAHPQHVNRDGSGIGIKSGKSSKYHYVFYDKSDHKFVAQVRIDKVQITVGRFAEEVHAAIAIDAYLDSINDKKRPRNRSEHTEVVFAHLEDLKAHHIPEGKL